MQVSERPPSLEISLFTTSFGFPFIDHHGELAFNFAILHDLEQLGKDVVQLAYEAYQDMAEKEMRKLCIIAREKWSLKHIALHHR
ncbi:Molybdopterin synthase catalytic subunit [Portunus trituberculatus]|uniref:Molybdopterin synthase catalytic subunit n=1 Tax=Portunus trituberculatus TaxID=210409 RepID=A0A5B7IWP7_PORTR|nr:Molybdopterin synthase catalytic subunit [Portunus trituberculatus]